MSTRAGVAVRACLVSLCLSSATPAAAQTARDLALTSLEDLMQIEVTSAGRKEQRMVEIAWAIYVITQDEIRRSGLRSVPELFRLAPGVQVAQLNSNKWAVSIRGFNDVFANKLLVLIDGRSIYKRTFGGVYWNAEDVMIEDIDRIEIIRGPGGVTWGANAVNGVINIITKSAAETRGGLVHAGTGTTVDSEGAARYGGRVKGVDYRVYGLWADRGPGAEATSESRAADSWYSSRIGFRADYERGRHTAMVQGGMLDGRSHALWVARSPVPGSAPSVDPSESRARTGDLLAVWTYTFEPGTALDIQSFYSRENLQEPVVSEIESIADVDGTFKTRIGRHDLVAGAGYRSVRRQNKGDSYAVALDDPDETDQIVNAFLQDEIAIGQRVKATVGAKFEHDSVSGANLLPTAQVIWETVPERQYLWASLDRAVRTPSLQDLGLRAHADSFIDPTGLPIMTGQVGNPDYQREEITYFEAGYRLRLGSAAALNISAFRGDYDQLPTLEPIEPFFETTAAPPHLFVGVRQENLLEVKTRGTEATVEVRPGTTWRLQASYSGLWLEARPDRTSRDPAAARFDGNAPHHQWQVRGSSNVGPRTELSAAVFYVGRLRVLDVAPITRVDARVEHRFGALSLVATAQNLFDRSHVEFTSSPLVMTRVRRSLHLRLGWRF